MSPSAQASAAQVSTDMARASERQPSAPPPDEAPATAATAGLASDAAWSAISANTLLAVIGGILALLGSVIVALLIYTLDTVNDRFAAINDRFAAIDHRFTTLENKMEARFAALEEDQDEIVRTLAVLVAILNLREEVDAALAGEIIGADTLDSNGEPHRP